MIRSLTMLLAAALLLTVSCSHPAPLSIQTDRGRTARAEQGMVVSAEENASKAGVEILMKGGNAVDAAVATGFALAVTYPSAGNLGGGGFMVIRLADGQVTTIDYREKAPGTAYRDMFLDSTGAFLPAKSQSGYLASGVPGSVAGLLLAHRRYGKLPLKKVMGPAMRLANRGFYLTQRQAQSLNVNKEVFSRFPATRKYFTRSDGKPYEPGYRFIQKDLGTVLKRIRDRGPDGFYRGKTADLIVAEMERGGGLITHEDLRAYAAVERPPVASSYRGYRVLSMGPPSSGGIALAQLLNAIEPFPMQNMGFHSASSIHLMGEAMRRVYADRAHWLGDPDFSTIPTRELIDKVYVRSRMADFHPDRVSKSTAVSHGNPLAHESMETTHYSVVDREGNAVSTTTTINGSFGSMVVVDGAGFFLNNEMDDFSAKPGTPNMFGLVGSETNAIAPGKRMLSSMTPTIVEDPQGRLFLVLGSPGGSTIITTVLQVMVNVIDHHKNIFDAVAASRVHHQWLPDELRLESAFDDPDLFNRLSSMGWSIDGPGGEWGRADAIKVSYPESLEMADERKGRADHFDRRRLLEGGADPRGEDTVAGY